MSLFKNKLVYTVPVIALAVIFIFSLTLFPSVQPEVKNLPIAIVNEDEGVEIPNQPKSNMGNIIIEMTRKMSETTADKDPAVKWIEVKNSEEVRRGLNNREYYAALIIPKDFSAKRASLSTSAPDSPELQILINQGMNTMASTMAGQVLNGLVDNLNVNTRTQLIEGFKQQGAALIIEQAASLATPIARSVTNVNEIGANSANGNAPVSLFQPLWMASIASAVLIYMVVSKMQMNSRKQNVYAKIGQIIMGAVIALIVGFGFTWIADGLVSIHIPQFMDTALFLSITAFSYYLMISAVISLLGIKGVALFVVMLFFGAPLLALAPEMMSSFYRDWVYSWLPMRFMVEGLRELFFFGKGLSWNTPVSVLAWIGAVSMAVIIGTAWKPNFSKGNAG